MVNHFRRTPEINMANTIKNIREDISSSQMARLKKEYEPLRKIDMSKHKGQIEKTTAMLSKLKMGTLIDLSKEDIPVISEPQVGHFFTGSSSLNILSIYHYLLDFPR